MIKLNVMCQNFFNVEVKLYKSVNNINNITVGVTNFFIKH